MYKLIGKKALYKADIDFDDGRTVLKDVEGQMFDATNIMHTLHEWIYNPITMVNDGLMEFTILRKPFESLGEFGTWY